MSKKLKVLMVSEASFISSGFGTYAKEILSRLHSTDKYSVAEFACYGRVNDPKDQEIKWKYYANAVDNSDPRAKEYNSSMENQFGRWRFERVLLDFRPDVVIDVRDYWMNSYQQFSPYRPYFHWILMPTVDSAPQQEDWIDTFLHADAVFTYSDFGRDTLADQSNNKINYIDTTSPGVNLDTFTYLDKDKRNQLRKLFGIDENAFVIGSVMRNQKRKLIPELLVSVKSFITKLEQENDPRANNVFLYLHTSYPDAGWDIPQILKEYEIGNRVLFTYHCRNCKYYRPSLYKHPLAFCPRCGQKTMGMPNVSQGLVQSELNTILNIFDLYVQYAICLGQDEKIKIRRNNSVQWIPISKIQIGDQAWTHNNRWRNVSRVWKNLPKSSNKKVMKISVYSDYETLLATENHEFPAYTSNELKIKHKSIRENIGYYLNKNKALPQYGKYELNKLKNGDILFYPIDDSTQNIENIDITQEINCSDYLVLDSFIETSKKYSYPRFISVDNAFCEFIGLFAADGTWNFNKTFTEIKITSNTTETNNQSIAKNIFKVLSSNNSVVSVRNYKNRLGVDNALCSKLHAQLFAKWFGKHTHKKLPDWALVLPTSKQKHILRGLFLGDGHFMEKNNTSIYCTISEVLADQIKTLLRRLRIQFNVRLISKQGNRKPQYRFEVPGNIAQGVFIQNNRNNSRNIYYKNYHLLQIKKIENSSYNKDTWCITVDDDHTMTTKIGATFQCEGFGMPQVEAGACGVPVATTTYSAMNDIVKNLNAFPIRVNQYFKELETKAIRTYPDNESLKDILYAYINIPDFLKEQKRYETRKLTEKYYCWDSISKKWEKYLDNLQLTGLQGKWDIVLPKISQISKTDWLDDKTVYDNFMRIISDKLINHQIASSAILLNSIRDCVYGFSQNGMNNQPYSPSNAIDMLNNIITNHNMAMDALKNIDKLSKEDYIEYSTMKENIK